MAMSTDAAPSRTEAGTGRATDQSQPLRPARSPNIVKVRRPARRACGPDACPDHWRSSPTARPPSPATANCTASRVTNARSATEERAELREERLHVVLQLRQPRGGAFD